ncbi:MAG: T9SS type A sorting domain-containing protein [Bacteroidetes bacterium]|nr:T9SS type A sorting domain-containing protein [Bacteroidota bacterium]
MKKYLFSTLLLSLAALMYAQTTIVDSIFVGGQYRSYRVYVPAIYTGATARPLILNLHGYTSNAQQQQLYSNFMPIADTANFLMVFPNGTYSSGQRFWNAGISNTLVNDIAFLSALIDSLDLTYNINLNRVYSTGMSNGGYMSHTLACELSNRITAIASVTGSIFTTQYGSYCHPTRPVPVMQIHGTSDPTVPYTGSSTSMPVDSVVKYWVTKNGCNPTAAFNNVPNTSTTDGCTAEHYVYSGGLSGSTVELFKIIGGLHTWPGFPFGGSGTNMDINASVEIWRFFNKYTLSALTGVHENESLNASLLVYPNPANSTLHVKLDNYALLSLEISDVLGKVVISERTLENPISIENLKSGIYFLSAKADNGAVVKTKFIKE